MAKSRSLQHAVRFALATATAAAGVTALHAQEAPAPAAAPAPVEEVVVTGSRLQTPNETSISPITTVSAVDLQQTGLTRVEDVLNNLPMVFAGMNSTTSNGADGTANVDLRGLGAQRTLVLVNGRRLGPGSSIGGRNFSDINQVPAALIERVDVLTGGASAVYGADAVAGVVNFILNTHFEGLKVTAGYHFNQHHNDNQDGVAQLVTAGGFPLPESNVNTGFGKNVSVLMGSNFADNKGNATAYITYDNQGAALQGKFDYSACSLAPTGGNTRLHCAGSGTSAKNGAGGYFQAYGPSGALFTNTVDGTTGLMRPFDFSSDLYNFGPLNFYQTPNERWTAGSFINYDVNTHVNVYAEVMFMHNSSQAQIAPSGDFFNPSFIPCADPLLTPQESATMCTPANLAANGGATETFNGVTYPGINMYIGRRNVEGGNRIATFVTNSSREVLGVKGDFGDAWTYDVYAQHALVDNNNGNLNYLNNTAIQEALNVLPGPGGQPVCGGPTNPLGAGPLVPPGTAFAPDPACVPWNIWHPNGVTAAQTAFLSVPLIVVGNTTEYVANGSVTGDLGKYGVKLPSADQGLQMNIGVEWREESTNYLPDFLDQQGSAAGSGGAVSPINGSFTVREAFTEVRLPLASHVAGADDLAFEGGYRYSKYSLGFNTNTYKLGLEWAPVRDARFRGSFQRAVRAPNIGELFTPQAVGLDGAHDPCSGVVPQATPAQCALTGVTPAQYGHIGANAAFQYNGRFNGNPNLVPEVADTYTVGLLLQPRVVPNLSVSIDYFHIKIDNRIGPVGGDAILQNCITTGVGCAAIHRDANGSLFRTPNGFVDDPNVNQGSLRTSGIDLKGSYRMSMAAMGSLLFSVEGTYLKDLITQPIAGGGSYDCLQLFGATCGGGNPKWRHVFNATWSTPWDGLDLNLRWRYFGSNSSESATTNPFLQKTPYLPLAHIAAFNYLDLTGTFNLYKNIRMELGINNIADKSPPIVTGVDCSTSSPAGANCNGNTFPGVYDAMGRYLFATVTAQF
ncbi:MAG: TonB-dependent receptor domain-containing protein [Steroidobacterales bacterium]|jgi:outer membrane receptor protein involved in Fe transport